MYKGQLEGFPTEIVEKMLERQVEQGKPKNISVFEKDKNASISANGFNWTPTPEGWSFWNYVINHKDFKAFFEKYPKKLYTIDEIESNSKLIIYLDSIEEFELLSKHTKKLTVHWRGKHCYNLYDQTYSTQSSWHHHGSYAKDSIILRISDINLNTNKNETTGIIETDSTRARGTAIGIPNPKRQVATASRPTGNSIKAYIKKARIEEFKISGSVITN